MNPVVGSLKLMSKTRFVALVMLSMLEDPLSDAAWRSTAFTIGPLRSIEIAVPSVCAFGLPFASVTLVTAMRMIRVPLPHVLTVTG